VRIALLHYTYLPVIAGVELVMAAHARLFTEAGHEVTIVCGPGAGGVPSMPAGARVVAIEEIRTEVGATDSETLGRKLREVCAAQDVVILHNVATMHFQPALTAALWRLADELAAVRFICWIHDLAACNPDYAPLPLDVEPWSLLTRAHPRFSYAAVSEWRRRQFLELTGQPASRCRTIPNGVDPLQLLDLPPRIEAVTREFRLLERDFVLIHPTRLLRRKNVELTLAVTAALKAAGHSCACLITAPPEIHSPASVAYGASLRALRDRLDLPEDALFLHDTGPLDDRDLRGPFQVADALFFPSRQEGFGIPLLEAAVHRLPVFCSDIEPLKSLLTGGKTTFSLAAPPDEIAAIIVRGLAADPAFAARKQTLRTLSWHAIYRNFLSPLLAETESL
jgi:glycosyltransferase involved in cell wall biosynthesis